MKTPARINRQQRRAKRREIAAAYRARLALAGKLFEEARTNDLAILRRLVEWEGV